MKTNFELLETKQGHFVKDVLLSEALIFPVYLGQFHFISIYLCLSWAISGYIKLSRTFSDHHRPSWSILVHLGLSLAPSSYHWLSQITSGCNELSRLSLAISGYLSQVSSIMVQIEAGDSKLLLLETFLLVLFFSSSFQDELQRSSRSWK